MFTSNWNHEDVSYMISRRISIAPVDFGGRGLREACANLYSAAANAERACAADIRACVEAERAAAEEQRKHA